ncbi:hypothetical protein GLOTRDRAFT_138026 [Gloeophyllum trabeum ATCC 11539]|uniref:Transcription factor domain-containing protein n=1 Tax=Gloeophyllum trabeum (strain ATCC 11539 / FP-39264 / Madison 617) TaxID=670483 RepID=S7RNX5_GLOTA|nr:uncharacterized protein GLOTRDRAFT_138026 [Gloeophyllum trabeum ATCC 11539]EPQ56235.1 hypothetical protein GLOTRDRAFT_138026 [Gloeophyllum trabeum ATCC 11539]
MPPGSLTPEELLGFNGPITPESLLAPHPPEPGLYDWIDTPMLAMQELLRRPPQEIVVAPASSISEILSQSEIDNLLAVFEKKYSPWLHLSMDHLRRHPFLDLAKCAVAARDLDPVQRSNVIPRLNALADSYSFKFAFTSAQSMETVTALLILSLWTPPPNTADSPGRDSRMIASSAVSAAIQLSLNQAVAHAVQLSSSRNDVGDSEKELAVNKVRLWLSLLSAEWMLCMGTGRTPTSQRSDLDYEVFNIISPHTLNSRSRDLRLYFLTRMQSLAGKGLQMHLKDGEREAQAFHDEVVENVLIQLEILYTSIQPLGVATDYESYHFNVLVMHYHSCRLLVLYHILGELRRSEAGRKPDAPAGARTWYSGLSRAHAHAVREWGLDGVTTAQALLIAFVSHPGSDSEFLATAPDSVFSMILMATALIVLAKTSLLRHYRGAEKIVLITSEELLPKVAARLNHIADVSDSARRCADVISVLLRTFNAEAQARTEKALQWQTDEPQREPSRPAATPGTPSSSSSSDLSSAQHHGMSDPQLGLPGLTFDSVFTQHINPSLTQDIMLDQEFWNSFALAQTALDPQMYVLIACHSGAIL